MSVEGFFNIDKEDYTIKLSEHTFHQLKTTSYYGRGAQLNAIKQYTNPR